MTKGKRFKVVFEEFFVEFIEEIVFHFKYSRLLHTIIWGEAGEKKGKVRTEYIHILNILWVRR